MQRAMKRLIDIVGGGLGLAVLSPLIGAVAITIRVKIGSPVLFRQTRPGRSGTPFELLKFRTMTDATRADGTLRPDDERLTPIGVRLRRWSLDELPELWNVLTGDMSLVGPRPLLMEYLPLYSTEQARRHEVRPGLTGLAQVSGRNELPWEERFALDVWYVDHWSIWLDVQILARTVGRVLSGGGISEPGQATMSPFEGTGQ